jgi:ankyrin repeat protein
VHKNFQEITSEAIISGDLSAFKKCCVGRNDINRRLLQYRDLEYKRKYNTNERYIRLRGPTMTMLAVLCEQDEILQYILETKCPDLSVRVDGYTALHLAAMIKDYRPLKLLIQYQWVQENINIAIELKGVPAQQGDFTTALHAAVSNHRLANIFLLISDFPAYKKMPEAKPTHVSSAKKSKDAAAEPPPSDDEPAQSYQPANVDQRSAAGSSPLYIAVFLKDPKAVAVLLAAGADVSLENTKGESPLKLAERLKQEAEAKERLRVEKAPQNTGHRAKQDPIFEVYKLLHEPPDADVETLKHQFAPELVPQADRTDVDDDAAEEEEEVHQDTEESEAKPAPDAGKKDTKKKKKKQAKQTKITNNKLDQISDLLNKLTQRMDRLETIAIVVRPGVGVSGGVITVCSKCGASPATTCPTCRRVFCERCASKKETHTGCVK